MKHKTFFNLPFIIFNDLLKFLIINWPGITGAKLRYFYYKKKFKKCGKNLRIDVGVHIDGIEQITIGDNVYIDKYCIFQTGKTLVGKITTKNNDHFTYEHGDLIIGNNVHIVQFCIIMAYGGIMIGDNSTISAGSKIYSLTNLPYDSSNKKKIISIMPYSQAPFLISPVVLEENVWVGLNCIIMPGTVIEKDSFVVSNSLVMSRFHSNSYIGGQPAKKIRDRFE